MSDTTSGTPQRTTAVRHAAAAATQANDPQDADHVAGQGSSARKHQAIIEAATALFLQQGFHATSMDEIAARAGVGKQTVYKHFADKERLFSAITLGVAGTAEGFIEAIPGILEDSAGLESALRALARRYVTAVLQPRVLQLRRLVIAEAGRFPELARTYYERVPERVLAVLADSLQLQAERGLLHLRDPWLAANHFAFLVLALPLDKSMFCGDALFTPAELEHFADEGVRVFLQAYGRGDASRSETRTPRWPVTCGCVIYNAKPDAAEQGHR